jgi:hypothetical protein
MSIHEISSALKLRTRQVWTILKHSPNPFLVNRVAPTRGVQIGERQMH